MRSRIVVLLLLIVGGAFVATAGDWFPHTARARRWCRLPGYGYSTEHMSAPVIGRTLSAVSVEPGVVVRNMRGAASRVPAKVYQLDKATILNDHCQLSNVSVTLLENGDWDVTFRAQQNPNLVEPKVRPVYERFRRNRFRIVVRGLGEFPLRDPAEVPVLAKPVYCELLIPDFWMERGEVRTIRQSGQNCEMVRRYFDHVDRMEVELRYE